jgi:hypothetical protein
MTGTIKRGAGTLQHTSKDVPVRGSQYRRDQFRQVEGESSFYASPAVTDEELAEWRDRMKLFEGQDKPVAKYKLEIQFGVDHHVQGTTYGVITIWENGSHFNGGADALLYACPGKHLQVNGCEAIIPDAVTGRKIVVCPRCFMAWKAKDLIGQTFYRLPLQKWAEVVHRWYIRLNLDADIRIKYHYDDIRLASEKEQEKELRGEVLERARSSARRKPRVYPLEYIIKDVNAGADLQKRILAFLRD